MTDDFAVCAVDGCGEDVYFHVPTGAWRHVPDYYVSYDHAAAPDES